VLDVGIITWKNKFGIACIVPFSWNPGPRTSCDLLIVHSKMLE